MNTQLHQLQNQNPGIALGTLPLHDAAALQALNWDGLDPTAVMPELLAYQRLWRLHPDAQVVEALLDLGISSAHQIAALGLGKFQQLAGAALRKVSPMPRLTVDLHASAQRTTAAVAQYAVHAIPSEFMSVANLDTRTSGLPDFHGDSPTYRELFGPITSGACNPCESIFSPAAYFVDLMQLIDEYITHASGNNIPAPLQLQARRPDLWQLLLNCENTVKELPYLQLANGIMASTLKPYLNGSDPWEYAATNDFPFVLPYNKPLEEIRAYAQHFGLSLAQVYAALECASVDVARERLGMVPEAYTMLKSGTMGNLEAAYGLSSLTGLSNVGTFLQQTGLDAKDLEDLLYQGLDGMPTAILLGGDSNFIDFGKPSLLNGLTAITIETWIQCSTVSQSGVIIGNEPGISADGFFLQYNYSTVGLYLSQAGATAEYCVAATGSNWMHVAATWSATTQQISIYINGQIGTASPTTSGYTGNSFARPNLGTAQSNLRMGDQASGGAAYLGQVAETRIWGIARTQAEIQNTMHTALRGTEAGLLCYWPMTDGKGRTVADHSANGINGTLSNSNESSYWELAPGLLLLGKHRIHGILTQFYINSSLSNLFLCVQRDGSDSSIKTCSYTGTYGGAPNSAWAALNAVIRLSNTLGWSYADVDWALKTIGAAQPGHWTDANLEDLAGILQLSQRLGQSIDAITGLWHDLKTYGKSGNQDRKSFWDATFNTPTAFANPEQVAQPLPYHPQYASNPFFTDTILLLDVASTETVYAQLRLSLSQALQTTEPDMTAILEYILHNSTALQTAHLLDAATVPSGSSFTLTTTMIALSVRNMSLIYRMARLPQWLKLPVDQFVALLPLEGMTGVGTVKQVLQLEQRVAWLQKNKLNVFAYAWLLGHPVPGKADLALPEQQRQSLTKSLVTGSQATMLTPRQLESASVSHIDALEIYAQLVEGRVIDARGLVLHERPVIAETIANAIAKSDLLRNKYKVIDPQQQAITFDGSNRVTLPFDIAAVPEVASSNSFTFAAWVQCTKWPGGGSWDGIWSTPTDTPPDGVSANGYKSPQMTLVGDYPGHVQVAYADMNHGWHAQSQVQNFPMNQWCHIAWVNDNGQWTTYLNGVPTTPYQTTATSIYQTVSKISYLGNGLHGQMLQASTWSAALSADAIQQLMYNAPAPTAANLLGYWPMNQGHGTLIPGYGPMSANARLTGGIWAPLVGVPIPPVAHEVLAKVQDALSKQNALALQKLASAFRVGNTQMQAIHALTAARSRSCLTLSGNAAYIETPSNAQLATSHFTLSAWVRITEITSGWQGIMTSIDDQTHQSPAQAYGYALKIDGNGLPYLQLSIGDQYTHVTAAAALVPGTWNCITATYDGSTAILYVNGLNVGHSSASGYLPATNTPLLLGAITPTTSASTLQGSLADLRYYSAALTATQVLSEMAAIIPKVNTLCGWWPLTAGTGTTCSDWSGNGLDAAITVQSGSTATWQNLHVNALLSPLEESSGDLPTLVSALGVNVALAQKFALDTADLLALTTRPMAYGLDGPILRNTPYTPALLESLADLRWLKAQYPASKDQWLKVMALYDPSNTDAALALVADLTGWSSAQVQAVLSTVHHTGLDTLDGLMRLSAVLHMATRLGVQPSYLVSLGVLSHLPATGTTTVAGKSEQNWAVYNALSASMANALQAQYSQDQLQAALAKVQGPLWEKERDILAPLLIHYLKGVVNDVNTLQDLYEYLLVDVKMASNVQISRIEQALDGLQLYVNRCMNGLETAATCHIPKAWWSWMGSYRQWQANREIYLYPENYADPSLRKAQTPLFSDLVNTLNQGQLTDENIEKALGQYLEGMAVVANLVVVDSYARKLTLPSGDPGTELYVLGRGHQDPPTYYLRRGYDTSGMQMAWTPWEQLSFSLPVEVATCIYAFNRLYVFWVQQTSKTIQDPSDASLQVVEATIYFTYEKLGGGWLQPQALLPTMPIFVGENNTVVIPEAMHLQGWDSAHNYWEQPEWTRVKLFALPATSTKAAQILVQYGDWVRCDSTVDAIAANPTNWGFTSPTAKTWKKMLEDANTFATGLQANLVTTLFPCAVLEESGMRSQVQVNANQELGTNLVGEIGYRKSNLLGSMVLVAQPVTEQAGIVPAPTLEWNGKSAFYPMTSLSNLQIADTIGTLPATSWNPSSHAIGTATTTDWLGETRTVMNFPGYVASSAYIPNYSPLNFTQAVTVCAWVQPSMSYAQKNSAGGTNPANQIVFGNANSTNTVGYAFGLYQDSTSTTYDLQVMLNGTSYRFAAPTIVTGKWFHIAFTWDLISTKVKAYLDGVALTPPSSNTFTSALSQNNASGAYCSIGEIQAYEGYYAGYMADLLVTGVALDAAQIQAIYAGTSELLATIESQNASTTPVGNRTGVFFANTGREHFLCVPADETGFMYVEDALTVAYPVANEVSLSFSKAMVPAAMPQYVFRRFGTTVTAQWIGDLIAGGVDAFLQLQTQYDSEPAFANYGPNALAVISPTGDVVDFSGPMREYFWELFFHIPLYVGNLLQAQQQFALARKWYEYVFVPEGLSRVGLLGYWPLDGNVKAAVGTDGTQGGSANPWVDSTFVDGKTRKVFNVAQNSITLDPSLMPQGDTVSISFWLYGNFPTSDYGLGTAILAAYTSDVSSESPTGGWGYNRLLEIYLLEGDTSSTTTSAFWEAGNDGSGWDSLYQGDTPGTYNGAWHFLTYTKNAATGSLKAYLDGKPWFSGTGYTKGFDFPCDQFNVNSGYQAYITELSIWSTELSANEIAGAYSAQLHNNWNFRPFAETAPATLAQTLTQAPAQLAISKYDPFDPDALAAIRWGAWEKNVFMHYVQNLIGWGDSLFTVDTWEAVSEATQLYVTAGDLLGIPPKPGGKLDLRKPVTYGQMEAKYGEGNIPEFLIDMETRVMAGATMPGGATMPAGVASILNGYFCIPDNQQLTQLWGLVANRLYKIRHGLNLQGQATQPALFGPPLNPADMVDGGAYGASGPSANNVQVPYYRFDQMIQLAKGFAQQVVSLGNELLAALEKQDGETLSQLRQTQESAIFNMTLQAKADMVNQLLQQQVGLQYSLDSAQNEEDTYKRWVEIPISPLELLGLVGDAAAVLTHGIGAGLAYAASPLYFVPTIFGLADGGVFPGDSLKALGEAVNATGSVIAEGSGLVKQLAGFARREKEWILHLQTVTTSIQQINAQMAANQFAIAAAQQDYSITQTQYQQSQDVLNFLQTKFTNEDLYVWMAGQLSTLYYQAYQMALELAQQAQTCYQYELSSSDTFLSGNPWNDQYKGLLAGDALSLSLSQMEKAYHDNNSRYQEIHKTFSLMQKDPQALLDLKQNGSCTFSFSELDFDLDFPGHYNRKIASISVTIPAVVGPYQNLNATLIQTSNQVLMKPDIEGVKSLLGMAGAVPKQGSIRSNWAPNQQISISTGINDAGLFQLNFNDPQYLPFEGTGAISNWQLIMPKAANAFDFNAITDVIIQISYTSSPGGQTFAKQVTALDPVRNYRGTLYLSLRQQFSSAWYAFLNSSSDSQHQLGFQLLLQQFPVNLSPSSLSLGDSSGNAYLALSLAPGVDSSDLPAVSLNLNNGGGEWIPSTGAAPIGNADSFYDSSTQTLSPKLPWAIAMDFSGSSGQDLLDSTTGRIDPTKLLDIVLVVPFTGELSW